MRQSDVRQTSRKTQRAWKGEIAGRITLCTMPIEQFLDAFVPGEKPTKNAATAAFDMPKVARKKSDLYKPLCDGLTKLVAGFPGSNKLVFKNHNHTRTKFPYKKYHSEDHITRPDVIASFPGESHIDPHPDKWRNISLVVEAKLKDSEDPMKSYSCHQEAFEKGMLHRDISEDDNLGGGVATEEEAFRPSKVARSGDATTTDAAPTVALDSEGPTDAEPLALGRDTLHGHDIDALLDFDSVPDIAAPDFFAPPFDALAALMSPQPAVPAELARGDDEPPVRTPEGRGTEDAAAVPAIPPAGEGDGESVGAASPSSGSSAPAPDPEPEVAQPAPRPLQWVVRNPGNQMGLEEDRRIGQTDFWCADAPAEHRHYRRSQPCDIPGCDVRFEPGNAASFAFHDGRTAGHKRLRYHCPRPGCNGTYGRADSMKRHLKDKQVCGDFVLGVLQPIYGQEAVPDIPRLAEWQVLPHFATMRS
ncbi:hypothetical protein FOMPIDRAFT_1046858 [Fomitopsis schrenkii]|uniref:Uncharacterized protein n=1 Tax=Fomitopsis schrenkii TaxID=2126942 RepID=S8FYN4_FOMSC|nr:hypothetical protein FOMPIDRAFT_1046858 [Fomitopsis schrenkii]